MSGVDAVSVENTLIHCDECHHEFPGEPPDWLNKACPKCASGILISERDMTIWSGMRSVMKLVNELVGPAEPSADSFTFHFDTAPSTAGREGEDGPV